MCDWIVVSRTFLCDIPESLHFFLAVKHRTSSKSKEPGAVHKSGVQNKIIITLKLEIILTNAISISTRACRNPHDKQRGGGSLHGFLPKNVESYTQTTQFSVTSPTLFLLLAIRAGNYTPTSRILMAFVNLPQFRCSPK